ncbi:MAG: S9 family peptidase [Balneolaceae bacterium]|nr:MAG: S9 family peptidase [Balneolaceae bacterium]
MKRLSLSLLCVITWFASTSQAQTVPENLTLKELFHEPVIPGIRPSFVRFNAEQDRLFFTWNDSSWFETGLYSTSLSDAFDYQKEDDEEPSPLFSPDRNFAASVHENSIRITEADGSGEFTLASFQHTPGSLTWSPDGTRLAFTLNGNIWTAAVESPGLEQVTNRRADEPSFTLDSWVGNDRLLLRQTDHSASRMVYFPDYLGEFVEPSGSTRGIPAVNLLVTRTDSTALDTLLSGFHRSSADVSSDGRYIAIDTADPALKQRKVIVHDLLEENRTVVFEDSTEGWLHHTYMAFSPDSEQLLLLSEVDGWNHIYTVNPDGSRLRQHTSGEFYVPWARWTDGRYILYASNEEEYGVRHLYRLNTRRGRIEQLTSETAYRYQFQLTPDHSAVVYAKTRFNLPYELYLLRINEPEKEIRITHTIPERFHEFSWQQEEYVRFTGRDGETGLSMSVLYPQNFDPENDYPVVVFAHGAGSLQNVYQGWSNNYWREYMFHQYLLLHGYVVVEVDFRHSTGYGRKFREDVTNWMGKYETEDIADGLDWLQESCGGCLDLNRVGIYGGSYGGFMALYALTYMPDRFHAGAALRKVTNWRNYYYANPWYTLPRLGDPEVVPEHYDRSSPLTYAGELTRPALLLHGLIDDNVGAQDAFQYAEELIQSGNTNFEMMIYPSERHGFRSPHSWYDEYYRIFHFFEKHLKQRAVTSE